MRVVSLNAKKCLSDWHKFGTVIIGLPGGNITRGAGIKWVSTTHKKRLCQFCVNLIGTSWHLVTQYATSVSASLIKIMGYGLDRGPFFVVGNTMGNK